ncbi:MAG TPA: MYXO-CTERM sorting domain-containing protein [Myxococcales bacterium]|nr:MYXO-CTERM sorting domain-containing protein [Myxococcales bacterium]
MVRKLLVGVVLFSVPALAQTIDGGQGKQCTVDKDCGACGWVCSWINSSSGSHTCVPADTMDANGGAAADPGWCTASTDCACAGQTCQGTTCTPGFTPQCACAADCGDAGTCDLTTGACHAAGTSCNYDGECGCGCRCVSGACGECNGGLPPSCTQDSDCGPSCDGYQCVGGTCQVTGTACLTCSGVQCPAGCDVSADCGSCIPTSPTAGLGTACTTDPDCCTGTCVGSVCTAATGTTGASTGGSSTGGACLQVGTSCNQNTDCCNQYCHSGACTCNKGVGTSFDQYPCLTNADCCSPATCATDGKCQGQTGTSGSGGSTGGAAGGTTGSATAGSTTGSPDGGTASSKSGCGCGAGGTGVEGLAIFLFGLAGLALRRRRA